MRILLQIYVFEYHGSSRTGPKLVKLKLVKLKLKVGPEIGKKIVKIRGALKFNLYYKVKFIDDAIDGLVAKHDQKNISDINQEQKKDWIFKTNRHDTRQK